MSTLLTSPLVRDLVLNLAAITVLAYGLYFRRHRRRDLLIGYVALNVSLFAVASALATANTMTVGVGFGLFAVLSIIRLRSDETTQSEIGYMMVALVLGLLCGLPSLAFEAKGLFVIVLVGAMYVVDHPLVVPPSRNLHYRVTLERIETDPESLREDLGRRLGGTVRHLIVRDVDYVRDTMRVDVRVQHPRVPRRNAQAVASATDAPLS